MGLLDNVKDTVKIIQQIDNVELYRKILDIQADALEMQEEIRKLKEENAEFKKKQDIEEQIERTKGTKYPCFTLKNDQEKIKYCATCHGLHGKLIQMSMRNTQPECIVCKSHNMKPTPEIHSVGFASTRR